MFVPSTCIVPSSSREIAPYSSRSWKASLSNSRYSGSPPPKSMEKVPPKIWPMAVPPAKRHRPATGLPQAVRVSVSAAISKTARKIFMRFNRTALTFF